MERKLTIKVLIGPPCVGKSTWVAKNATPDEVIVSSDNIITEAHPDKTYNEAYSLCNHKDVSKEFKKRLLDALKERKSIIVDRTNLSSKSRRKLLASVPKEYSKIAVLFNWDLKVLKERNAKRNAEIGKFIPDKVFEDMLSAYSPIREHEGFDKVIKIK